MTIKELIKQSHKTAVEKGFWEGKTVNIKQASHKFLRGEEGDRNNSELLMLMVTELGEACEALRHGNPQSEHIPEFTSVEEELADTVIRLADMCGARGYRLEEALKAKMKFNKGRAYKHGKKF